MLDSLIGGRLHGAPKAHVSKTGKPFVTAKVRTPMADGDSIFVNVIAFAEDVVSGLLALSDGDAVSMSGQLSPKVWQPTNGEAKPALDLVAHALVTVYHVSRKRQQVQGPSPGDREAASHATAYAPLPDDFPDDRL